MSTPMIYYFDDPEEGLSPQTSHPRFASLAKENFYYSCSDELSPFGSDDGSDTFSLLEEWYQEKKFEEESISQFLCDHLETWDLAPANIIIEEGIKSWEEWWQQGNHIYCLESNCRAGIACALGQLKITGTIDPEMIDTALKSIECMHWVRRVCYGEEWPEQTEYLESMKKILEAVR